MLKGVLTCAPGAVEPAAITLECFLLYRVERRSGLFRAPVVPALNEASADRAKARQ
jgi:hypothetical protein